MLTVPRTPAFARTNWRDRFGRSMPPSTPGPLPHVPRVGQSGCQEEDFGEGLESGRGHMATRMHPIEVQCDILVFICVCTCELSRNAFTISRCPQQAAQCKAVRP